MCVHDIIVDIKKVLAVLFVAVAHCQETLEDETGVEDKKEKRGISLNLGDGLGPSLYSGRGSSFNRGYTPIAEYGMKLIVKLKLMFNAKATKY